MHRYIPIFLLALGLAACGQEAQITVGPTGITTVATKATGPLAGLLNQYAADLANANNLAMNAKDVLAENFFADLVQVNNSLGSQTGIDPSMILTSVETARLAISNVNTNLLTKTLADGAAFVADTKAKGLTVSAGVATLLSAIALQLAL